jgi:putative heme-binding domain-containing protein
MNFPPSELNFPARYASAKAMMFRVFRVLLVLLGLGFLPGKLSAETPRATAADTLTVPPGFRVELLHSAKPNEGSWISMAVDSKGRLIISPQEDQRPLLRVSFDHKGQIAHIEPIPAPLRQAMGMAYAFDSLYVNGHGPNGTGLYRLMDTNRNDQFDTNEVRLLKKFHGEGEHGYHAVVAGPDQKIYVMNGNHTKVPEGISPRSPYKNYQEDFLLTRQWDANGHAVGVLAPGGYITRADPDGKDWELLLGGFRNSYDFDFSPDGEMFTFDSDMEWDWGLPWYRPTRILHCVTGGEYGWRSGTSNEPDYYADTLPPVVNIGIGSPTGVKFATKSKFPKKYQQALFAMDWSYGRIFAVHLQPQGASYTGTPEEFLKGKALNVTDLEFGKDGALYFITGGRGTQSGLYRVSYDAKAAGKATAEPARPMRKELKQAAKARAVRKKLESFHGKVDAKAIGFAWPHLASNDRFLRTAARIAIEWQPVAQWQQRALAETNSQAAITALLALARCGGAETQAGLLRALGKFPLASLSEELQLEKVRVIQLSFIRQGQPTPELAKLAVEKLDAHYPAASEKVNRELVQLLIYLNAPEVIAKTLALLDQAPTQEEQIHYIFHLRNVKSGWTPAQREKYFSWFVNARQGGRPEITYPHGAAYHVWTNQAHASRAHSPELLRWFKDVGREYGDGASFTKYLINIRKDAAATLTSAERAAVQPLLEVNLDGPAWKAVKERQFVKEWTTGDLAPRLGEVAHSRDFENGKAAFNDAQCVLCHRFANEGGSVGPELSGVGSKYSLRDILESITEPSKVVSDQFQTYNIWKKDGDDVSGRITDENKERIIVMPSMLAPDVTVEVPLAEIARREPAKASAMPTSLLDQLSEEEVLDLLAYLQTGGQKDAANFKGKP